MSAPPRPPTHSNGPEPPALGSNPFDSAAGPDPFVEELERLGLETPTAAPAGTAADAPPRDRALDLDDDDAGPDWRSAPPLSELHDSEPPIGIESFVPAEVMQRVGALAYLAAGESSYDRYGFSPDVTRRAFPFLYALYRYYFRVESEGHEHIPAHGPALMVGNHAGVLPFDAAMIVTDSILRTDPPRLPRSVVDIWAGSLPWVNVLYARGGQVIGTRENCADLLNEGQLLLVFPEGVAGVRKTIAERYQLRSFRVGFVEQAIAARAPVVPVAVIGSENQMPVLFNFEGIAKRLGLPAFPITPTFPWLGPLGLLPYPVSYRIVYGEPLHLAERFDDPSQVQPDDIRSLSMEVQQVVQELIDRNR
jgi:1-acyl-sn-glycerol-3-phosphate acyltransferase